MERKIIAVAVDGTVRLQVYPAGNVGAFCFSAMLTADEARRLSKRLQAAVDELPPAVSAADLGLEAA